MAQMANHDNRYGTLGMLWAVYAVLMIAAAVWIILYNRTLMVMWGAIISRVADPFTWTGAFHLVLVATIAMALISATLSVLAAVALMQGAAAARTLGLIAAALGMLGTPPGIALGVFTIAILFPLRGESHNA
jgi:ABC-type phosphate transport system permease subunit